MNDRRLKNKYTVEEEVRRERQRLDQYTVTWLIIFNNYLSITSRTVILWSRFVSYTLDRDHDEFIIHCYINSYSLLFKF